MNASGDDVALDGGQAGNGFLQLRGTLEFLVGHFCHANCVPHDGFERCEYFGDRDACREVPACRWLEEKREPVQALIEGKSSEYMRETACYVGATLFFNTDPEAGHDELIDLCRREMGCDSTDDTFCTALGLNDAFADRLDPLSSVLYHAGYYFDLFQFGPGSSSELRKVPIEILRRFLLRYVDELHTRDVRFGGDVHAG